MIPGTLPKLDFIRANAQLFQRCGSVVASYRTRNGRRFGPYYRIAYLQRARQRSLYLGRSETLAQQAQELLDQLQKPRNDRRDEKRATRRRKASLLRVKRHWQQTVLAYGLYFRGWHVRGFRACGFPRVDKITPTKAARTPKTQPGYRQNRPAVDQLHKRPAETNHFTAATNPTSRQPRRPRYWQNRLLVDQLHKRPTGPNRFIAATTPSSRQPRRPRYWQNRLLVQHQPISPPLPRGPPHSVAAMIFRSGLSD